MHKISRVVALLNGQDLTPRNPLEKAVKTLVASIGKGGNAPLEVAATTSESGGKTVVTLDKTAAELFAAAQAGRAVSATATVPVGEDKTGKITMILPIEVFRMAVGDTAVYTVKVRADADATDALFFGDNFAADDTVVLTEV